MIIRARPLGRALAFPAFRWYDKFIKKRPGRFSRDVNRRYAMRSDCTALLDRAEAQIQILSAGASGEAVLSDFDPEAYRPAAK